MRQYAERRARAVLERLGERVNPVGVEVGVYLGDMSAQLLRLCPDLTLYMVDDWKPADERLEAYRRSGDPRARDSAAEQEAHLREATEATAFARDRRWIIREDSTAAAALVPNASCDFVFIDADHSYEGVARDIAAWTPKVRPGGILSGHDYCPPGKYTARGWPGVVRAVDEAVERNGWTLSLGDRFTWFVDP